MKILKILLLLLISPALCLAGSHSVQIMQGSAGGGSTEPASGTVILGSTTTTSYTESFFYPIAYEELFNHTALTATWSESASTTALASLGVYVRGHAGGNCKMTIRNSSLGLIATSNAKSFDYEDNPSLQEFTFSSPPTITKGTSYVPGLICDTDYAVAIRTLSTGTDMSYGTNGSYASPAATLTETTSSYPAIGPIYGKH